MATKVATDRRHEVEVLIRNLNIVGPLPQRIEVGKFDPMLAACIVENEKSSRDKGKPLGRGKFSLGNALDWENKFKLRCDLSKDTLQVELWDDNVLRDTFLACARLPLRALLSVPGSGVGVMERSLQFLPGEAHTMLGTQRGVGNITGTFICRVTRIDAGVAELAPEAVGVSLREIPAGASALPASATLAAGAGMKVTQPASAALGQPSTFVEQGVVYERGVQNVSLPSSKTVTEQVPRTYMEEQTVQVPRVIMVDEVVQVPKTVMETQMREVPTMIPAQQDVARPVGVERVTQVTERVTGAVGPAEPIGPPRPVGAEGQFKGIPAAQQAGQPGQATQQHQQYSK